MRAAVVAGVSVAIGILAGCGGHGSASSTAPAALTYRMNPAVYTKGSPISANTPTCTGGAVSSYSVWPALPAGLVLDASTGVISGTPAALAARKVYTVTARNSGGFTSTGVAITVNDLAPSALAYAKNPAVYTRTTTIAGNTPTSTGGDVASYSVSPPLPVGLTLDPTTGAITGTPAAVTPQAAYTVTARNSGGSATANVIITVVDVPPGSLTYSTNPAVYTMGAAITANAPSSVGGPVTSYSVFPSLPAGLTLDPSTGAISGTPTTVTAQANYTVTATNSGGFTTAGLAITVIKAPPSTLTYSANPVAYAQGVAIPNNSPIATGEGFASYSVAPALPAGLSLDPSTGIISGIPTTITPQATYTVTGTNSEGFTTVGVVIAVTAGGTTYSISGVVSGAVATGVAVSLTGAAAVSTTTNTSGHYDFIGLTNGSFTVTPSLTGYAFTPGNRNVTVTGNKPGQDFVSQAVVTGTLTEFATPTGLSETFGITVGPDGNLWFSEFFTNQIGCITPGGVITEFAIPGTKNPGPENIAAGPDGNLWFTEWNVSQIGRIDPSGVVTEFKMLDGAAGGPVGIAAGPDGNLWFTQAGQTIFGEYQIGRITPSGVITEFTIPGPARGISAGPDGNLWFTEGGQIGCITPSGVVTEFAVPGSFPSPTAITTGPDGNLWFINGNNIGRMTTSGVATQFPIPTASSNAESIAAGPDGNLWFTENSGRKIGRITTSGVITEFSADYDAPLQVVAGPDGNLWFTDGQGDKIGRITP
jgi:streptogramin lyase